MATSKRVAFMASTRSVPRFCEAGAEEVYALHGGNTGNVAFVNAIASHLTGEVQPVAWHATPEELKRAGDVVVIACANELGAHTDLAGTAESLEKAGLPVIALGLGAQADLQADSVSLTPGTRRWLAVVAGHPPCDSPNIGARGTFSLEQVEKLGHRGRSTVIGCPSNFTNRSYDYISKIQRRSADALDLIACAIGHPFIPSLGPLERQIIALVDQTGGTCIAQHDVIMIQLAMREFYTIDASVLEQARRYFHPNLTLDQFKRWCRTRLIVFGDADQWMAWLKRYDFVVGPRFHGVMLALQAGVPAGCIAHDRRTLEMCETMCVPVRPHDSFDEPITLANLSSLFPFDARKYRETRAVLAAEYVSLLRSAMVQYDPRLDELAHSPRCKTVADVVTD